MNSLPHLNKATVLLLVGFGLACFGPSATVKAVNPPPDGGYPGQNTAEGDNALFSLSQTQGALNTAVGWDSLFSNVDGSLNTGIGAAALAFNTSHNNTAVGAAALLLNTSGDGNTATGVAALLQNTTGRGNTATGGAALFSNTVGLGNTAVGAQALFSNIGDNPPGELPGGAFNTAVGLNALTANTDGSGNTAVGGGPGVVPQPSPDPALVIPAALGSNTTGSGNTAVGSTASDFPAALGDNTTGGKNTAVGVNALARNMTGFFNTAVGSSALRENTTGGSNTAVGNSALSNLAPSAPDPGNNNVALGGNAGTSVTSASNVICIGANVTGANVSNTTYIGNINATAQPIVMGVDGVTVDLTTGKLGHGVSSRRFKEQIKPMDEASSALYALKPVTFHYKKAIDPTQTLDFGLIAEEVAAVNPELAVRDREGKISDYRHDAVNAMLLNEFLKAHRRMEEQEATIAKQQKQIDALNAGLQKVSAQVELNKPAPQTVLNRQ